MKKLTRDQQQKMLRLGRETIRVLTAVELRRAGGGNETPATTDKDSKACSMDIGICLTGPECD